ncbi:putative myristoylated membrane protein [Cotonvirus japonicus]|uniref:Myristoylated membrane protein n=1 Tax=Cotonvirus japonicus TaxID=2811091 RepID=A0ABM7NSW3_9VIRU|nr:putative myristoylated membrane protein [Cotonvirus japonicus]BCS83260.1 putative myristoylated membrane protein [Cotonvirus japonicus]
MGASVSTNEQNIENSIINKAYNSCPSIGSTNVVTLSGIQFDPPTNCNPEPVFEVGQTSTIDSKCLLTSLQSSVAEIAATLDAKAKAGLGISSSTNVNDISNNITQITKNKCANVSTTNRADITDTVIKSCQFEVIQNATENVSCQINATQALASKVAASATGSATGGSIWGDLFGGGIGGIIIGILIIALIIGLIGLGIYLLRKNSNKVNTKDLLNSSTLEEAALLGGFKKFTSSLNDPVEIMAEIKRSKIYKFLIILLLILIIIILFKTLNLQQNTTPSNLNNLPTQIINPSNTYPVNQQYNQSYNQPYNQQYNNTQV